MAQLGAKKEGVKNLTLDNVVSSVYVGYNVGEAIISTIQGAKRSVKICSPYINKETLQMLEKKADNEKDMGNEFNICFVTTQKEGKQDNEVALELRKCNSKYVKSEKVKFRIKAYTSHKNLANQNAPDLENYLQAHAKIYLIDDDVVFLTSANFSNNGMFNNFETCVRVEKREGNCKNNELIAEIEAIFQRLLGFNEVALVALSESEIAEMDKELQENAESCTSLQS